MLSYIWVGGGGAICEAARVRAAQRSRWHAFLYGGLAMNGTGSFIAGLFATLVNSIGNGRQVAHPTCSIASSSI
jgi:fluoride ion exporter CrcB/FEX